LIEDNPADAYLVREALNAHGVAVDLVIIRDGEEAFQLVEAVDHDESLGCPSLFLLDLNLPRRSGEEVLGHIRKSRRCANTPVVIVTSSDAPRDRAETERLGATHYFRKPTSYMGYLKVGEIVKDMLSGPAS
jgi:two-component system, chemotaxis family, response regulator Rcp1